MSSFETQRGGLRDFVRKFGDDDEATLTVHRPVDGDHLEDGCWCRPLIMRSSQVSAFLAEHPGDNPVGLDS